MAASLGGLGVSCDAMFVFAASPGENRNSRAGSRGARSKATQDMANPAMPIKSAEVFTKTCEKSLSAALVRRFAVFGARRQVFADSLQEGVEQADIEWLRQHACIHVP